MTSPNPRDEAGEQLYRFLDLGETIEAGDECPSDNCERWEPVNRWAIGSPRSTIFKIIRRPAAKPPSRVDAVARTSSGCFDKDGNELFVGDRVRYRHEGSHTTREYWNPEYEIIFDAPCFSLKHIGGGKDGGSHLFILKHGGGNGDLELIQRGPASLSPAATSGSEDGGEIEQLKAYRDELLKIAADVGEPDDPFAAWEAIAALKALAKPASSPAGGDVREAFETCAAICEARAEYFDLAPSYREWTDAARSYRATAKEIRERAALSASTSAAEPVAFQQCVQPWMMACFGAEISADVAERNHRFLEESLELVQSTGCTASEAHQLVDYVYGRDIGETNQEIGGVMVTLAALCLALGEDMHAAGETELARIWTKVEKIRAKQAAKPKHSPLPQHVATPPAPAAVDGQRVKDEGFVDGYEAAMRDVNVFRVKIAEPFDSSFDTIKGFVADMLKDNAARLRACLATDKEGA